MSQPDVNAALGNPAGPQPAAEPFAAADFDPPLWTQNVPFPAMTDRLLVDAVWPTGGVLGATELAVGPRALGANMSVDVAVGRAVIAGSDTANQGKYLCRLKVAQNVVVAAAPAAGLTRRDLIYGRVYDAAVISGTRNDWTVAAVTGTAVSANPQAPAVPPSSVPLADITVASGTAAITAAMIADRRNWLGRPPAPEPRIRLWNPAAGTMPPAGVQIMQYVGSVVLNATAANWAFTFPWGPFQYGYTVTVGVTYLQLGSLTTNPTTLDRVAGQAWNRDGSPYNGNFAMDYVITGA